MCVRICPVEYFVCISINHVAIRPHSDSTTRRANFGKMYLLLISRPALSDRTESYLLLLSPNIKVRCRIVSNSYHLAKAQYNPQRLCRRLVPVYVE